MMPYITAQQAAEKWGVSLRYVQRLMSENRISGAKKYGRSWMIPADAEKPEDPRKAKKLSSKNDSACLLFSAAELLKNAPTPVLLGVEDPFRPLAAADLAFRRGDPEPAKKVWYNTPQDSRIKLSAASLATAAAISSGDYKLYDEILRFLHSRAADTKSPRDRALLSLPETLAAVSMAATGITPDWLKNCDFSLFPYDLRPLLLYLYAMHLRNTGDYIQMLGITKAALALNEKSATFTWLDLYLGVLCANASYMLGDTAQAQKQLVSSLKLGMPFGFIAPFADHLGTFGGMLDAVIEREYPQSHKAVTELWSNSFKNWIQFHNTFTRENITTILNQQEYQTARLITGGATYAQTAQRMNLSVSRVKNILADVYAKLCIQSKQELNDFIL